MVRAALTPTETHTTVFVMSTMLVIDAKSVSEVEFFLQSSSSGLIARNDLFCYKDWQFIVIVILSLIYWIVTRE